MNSAIPGAKLVELPSAAHYALLARLTEGLLPLEQNKAMDSEISMFAMMLSSK
jgi:hypothetical protein